MDELEFAERPDAQRNLKEGVDHLVTVSFVLPSGKIVDKLMKFKAPPRAGDRLILHTLLENVRFFDVKEVQFFINASYDYADCRVIATA